MQIEIDFEVFKALTIRRESEADTYNDVIRRLLSLPADGPRPISVGGIGSGQARRGMFGAGAPVKPTHVQGIGAGLMMPGAIFNGIIIPEGTLLRATYKGVQYAAEIRGGRWVDQNGVVRSSPSDAANAISHTNVNGWRFWHAKPPGEADWVRLDELK